MRGKKGERRAKCKFNQKINSGGGQGKCMKEARKKVVTSSPIARRVEGKGGEKAMFDVPVSQRGEGQGATSD